MNSSLWRWAVQGVLWLGILLCALAVFRGADSVRGIPIGIAATTWLLLVAAPFTTWCLAVAAWRLLIVAYTGDELPWAQAFRQSGLLLVGKYVPGGVFGFLARLYDAGASKRSPNLAAGLTEQLLGILTPVLVGATCYGAAVSHDPWLLALLIPAPMIAVAVAIVAIRTGHKLRWWRGRLESQEARISSRPLLVVATLLCLQQLVWVLLAWQLTRNLSELSALDALGVSGCFGLAVAAGMLILIAPGGIGVREGALIALALPWLTPGQALMIASILRLASTGLDVVAGVVAFVLKRSAVDVTDPSRNAR